MIKTYTMTKLQFFIRATKQPPKEKAEDIPDIEEIENGFDEREAEEKAFQDWAELELIKSEND